MREKNGLVYLAAVCIASATITACAGVDLRDKVATSLVATESNATKSSIDEAVSSLSVARPERLGNIKLAEYRNLAVSIPSIAEITDIDVNDAIRNRLKTKATFVNEVQTGDTVNIDFNGKIDGNEFDGGNAEGYELEIGSGAFIDGFEDSLIGMKNGETKDISLTFPSDYSNEELAGKNVIFTVTVNEIKRIPELTDALVKELDPSCDGVEDYKKKVLSELISDNDFSYMRQKGYAALEELESLSDIEVSDEAVEWARNLLIAQYYVPTFENYYGMSFSDMLKKQNVSLDEFKNNLTSAAKQLAEDTLVIDTVAKEANIEITDADKEEYAKEIGTTMDVLQSDFGDDYINLNVKEYKVLNYLTEQVVYTYLDSSMK